MRRIDHGSKKNIAERIREREEFDHGLAAIAEPVRLTVVQRCWIRESKSRQARQLSLIYPGFYREYTEKTEGRKEKRRIDHGIHGKDGRKKREEKN